MNARPGRSSHNTAKQSRHNGVAALLLVASVVAALAGCRTTAAPAPAHRDAPVLSLWADPATSIAITWFDEPEIVGVEMAGPDRPTTTVEVERLGPVTRALVDGLEPSTTYRYRAVEASGGDSRSRSGWRTFTTAPPAIRQPADSDVRLEFAVAGDLQPFNVETRRTIGMVMRRLESLDPAFIVQVGDVSEYGFSRSSWQQAFSVLTLAAAEIPLVPAAGNHDHYGVPAARFFKRVFPAPYGAGTEERRNTWYSQTIGPVHVAVLDTQANGKDADEQLTWLEGDLRAARERGTPWIFMVMHRPILSTSMVAADPQWARDLLPLVARYDVSAVFWGHDHLYEHFEYRYGDNGYLFSLGDEVAARSAHLFTVGTSGARVNSLYMGFGSHNPRVFALSMFNVATGNEEKLGFQQRHWNSERLHTTSPGIRYQDPTVYPDAASYYSWPFDSPADAAAVRYSENPAVTYSDAMPFFGYTYGETSIHYLWVEIQGDTCTISAHYLDGDDGEQGPVITRPDGGEERFVIQR